MSEHLAPPCDVLAACGLPAAWARLGAWTVLDADFEQGRHFFDTWLAWQRDPLRPRVLHYVGIVAAPLPLGQSQYVPVPENCDQPRGWGRFFAQCASLKGGFHRILLDGGHVSLTLCIGDLQSILGEHAFQADTVFACAPSDKWAAHMLARRCKRGTRLHVRLAQSPDVQASAWMQAAGFRWDESSNGTTAWSGNFNPRWDIPTSRTQTPYVVQQPARCAVVGAGIAGASVAHALALRGWSVTVFDGTDSPAGGASGLPVGLAVPHVSVDDNPRARLSRSGCSLLAQHAQRLLLRGQDWDPCGVEERRPEGGTLWHAQACWIKPAQLVQAWLAGANIGFVGNRSVGSLRQADKLWQLHDQQGLDLGQFEVVVLANAMGSASLLESLPTDTPLVQDLREKLAALQAVHGTLSYGSSQTHAGFPETPINGNGCFIPRVPGAQGDQWFVGSTFETDEALAADGSTQQAANMLRLRQLLSIDGKCGNLPEVLGQGPMLQWSGTRCVTHDRMPLVGPIDAGPHTGLWVNVGMGSRGLSFSALCAELLAARLCGEPLPVELSLSRSLDVSRTRRRSNTKNQA